MMFLAVLGVTGAAVLATLCGIILKQHTLIQALRQANNRQAEMVEIALRLALPSEATRRHAC
jgi:hypothetical protein